MVDIPKTRHSKPDREPKTIDLEPGDVSRVGSEAEEASAGALPDQTPVQDMPPKEDIGASVTEDQSASDMQARDDRADDMAEDPASAPTQEDVAAASPETASGEAGGAGSAFEQATAGRPVGAETPDMEPPRAAPAPRTSMASLLGAGVVGGVAAIALGAALYSAGFLGAPGGGSVPASVEAEIAGLRSEVETLKSASGAPADLGGLDSQVTGLSQEMEQLRADLASVRQAVEAAGTADGGNTQALEDRIAGIESRISEIGPGTEAASSEDIATINERIAGVEALANAATEANSAADSRLGALEQRLSALTSKVDAQAGQPKIALAIAASALKAAIERGEPFQSELETFAAVAPEAPGLADLRNHAENGVATRAELVAEVDSAAKAMIAAANPPPADAGIFERLLTSAESLVTVRPIGAVEGAGVPETVARMEVALQAGDLEQAVAEYETLPEAAKAAGADFADKVKARLAAEQLADQAVTAAMQAA
jgi:hypothetical protein